MKAPKYIQLCIKRMFFWKKVVENNARKVENWMKINKIDRNTPLTDFLTDDVNQNKKKQYIAEGQMSIFDYLEREVISVKDN